MSVRVGVVGPAEEDDFATNIVAGLSELKIPAVSLGAPAPPLAGRRVAAITQLAARDPRLGPLLERSIVARAREAEVDLVITVISLTTDTVRALKATGARVALWFPDHVANLGPSWMFKAPYDGIFFKEPALVRRVTALLDIPVYYLPEACNPRIHRPVSSAECVGKVAVVGNLHPIRARLLERLATDGVPLAIYGPPSHAGLHLSLAPYHAGRYVRGLDKSAVFGSASAVLNNLHPSEMDGMNCRLFEATAAGGAVVSEHRPELDSFFKVGQEVLAFSTYAELRDALGRLIEDGAYARRLGEAASRRAHTDHTYAERLRVLLDHVDRR